MALGSYSDLKSAIADWLYGRTDILTAVDDFIDLCEGELNRVLRVRRMEASSTLTLDASGEASLPTDYLAWRTVTYLGTVRSEVEYAAPSYIEDTYGDRPSGTPAVFTIRGSTILVAPSGTDDQVRLDYYQSIPALSDSQTTNWLLTLMPNAYLYGALKHAAVYIADDAAANRYGSLMQTALDALITSDEKGRYARVSARISGPTP